MYCSRISNLPFLYKPDGIYESITKSHFRLNDSTSISVNQPKITNRTMYRTNFKMNSGDRSGDFATTHSDFKPMPVSRPRLVQPITTVRISVPEGKYPEPTYRSSYTKHEVSPVRPAKESGSTGQYCTLTLSVDLYYYYYYYFEWMTLYFLQIRCWIKSKAGEKERIWL